MPPPDALHRADHRQCYIFVGFWKVLNHSVRPPRFSKMGGVRSLQLNGIAGTETFRTFRSAPRRRGPACLDRCSRTTHGCRKASSDRIDSPGKLGLDFAEQSPALSRAFSALQRTIDSAIYGCLFFEASGNCRGRGNAVGQVSSLRAIGGLNYFGRLSRKRLIQWRYECRPELACLFTKWSPRDLVKP